MKKCLAFGIMPICFGSIIFCAGCGYSSEEKAQMESNEALGQELVIEYVRDKYGFDPVVNDMISEKEEVGAVPNLWPDATGYIMATCSDGYRTFDVVAKAEAETDEIWDNYEYDMVKEAVSEAFETVLGTDTLEVSLRYGHADNYAGTGLLHEKFSSLVELGSETKFNVIYHTLSDIDQGDDSGAYDLLGALPDGADIAVVAYRDEQSFEDCANKDFGIDGYPITGNIKNYSIYIRDYFTLSKNNGYKYTKYKTQTFEDGAYTWYFVYAEGDVGELRITPGEEIDPAEWDGRGFQDAESLGGIYSITFLDANGAPMESGGSANLFLSTVQLGSHTEYGIVSAYTDGSSSKKSRIPTSQVGASYITGTIYNKNDLVVTLLGEK
jgi:hypothetical protein